MRSRRKPLLLAVLTAALLTAGATLVPGTAAQAEPAECNSAPWNSGSVYVGGNSVTHDGGAWRAKWWTQGEEPGTTGQWGVWESLGACDGGGGGDDGGGEPGDGFVVSEAQFNQFFPNRNPFYTYSGLVDAMNSFPAFAHTGSDAVQRREAAAFLANVSHETGGLVHIVEQNTANYPHYCDTSQPYGCPAGHDQYYGRGPIQLSWNFNYKAAGDHLGLDLLHNPSMVQNNSSVAWRTALWYWNTQSGPGTMTGHAAMVNGAGFGETIRSINGSIECNGGNPAQVQSRVDKYRDFTARLGVDPGGNLYC
ncbi:glycoside hydrolase family 19 protein [Myceligenerans pegani]|uniref:Chitinase n=1 Tax=Myceligenerans pegani TaxID=2776917 RepID=A0ABR9MY29_9MICO|nr:glycoside hydrolase family 19 protein [Myceligenerans sp. TRM 65318]MBE1876288.1 chitinase [Myceligenerans sp. TRM 65318]MBE3018559.1 chitinase [Myceligenerans sp. TRM 65318]